MKLFDMLTTEDMKRIKAQADLVTRVEDLQKEVEELKAELARAKEDHQYDNMVHERELESLRKK